MGSNNSKSYPPSIQLTLPKGEIIPLDELYEGKPFFRKYMSPSSIELVIYRILKELEENGIKNQNIVDIYRIEDNYVDVELLENIVDGKDLKKTMREVKSFLQDHNIVYIDWKNDNIGIDREGNYKLFDFDGGGLFCNQKWIIRAPEMYVMRNSPEGYSPTQIDDWSLEKNVRDTYTYDDE